MPTVTEQAIALALDSRVHDAGAWADLVVGEHPAPTAGMLRVTQHAEESAREYARKREESFDRCDTDGFLTQWAHGIASDKDGLRAKLLRQGGYDVFPTLFNRETGEQVNAILVDGNWGSQWAFLDANGRRTGRYLPDARQSKRTKLWKEGFVVLGAWHPARAIITGSGYGLSGSAWATTKRCDFDEREGADLDAAAA